MSQSLKKAAVFSMCKQWWLDQPAQDCEKEKCWLDSSHHMSCPIIISQVYINKIRTLSNSQQVRILGWSQSKLSLHAVITVSFLMARLNVHSQELQTNLNFMYKIKKKFLDFLSYTVGSQCDPIVYMVISVTPTMCFFGEIRNACSFFFFFFIHKTDLSGLWIAAWDKRQWMKINDAMTCISSIDWYRTGNIWIKYENNMNSKMIRDFMNLYNFTKKP